MPGNERDQIAAHYGLGGLQSRIEAGLAALDVYPSIEALAPVDDFHVGGRAATEHLLNQLAFAASDHVLDIGSGLGGPARFVASTTGAQVTGVDLTIEYVEVANWLTDLVGLQNQVQFRHTAAGDIAHLDLELSAAIMVHVGMNIANKTELFIDVAAALQPQGVFAIYDLMAVEDDGAALTFPVPWATDAATSHVESVAFYTSCLETAGFTVEATSDRSAAAIAALGQLAQGATDGPAPLGLHLVMGPETPIKVANMRRAIETGLIAPTEIIARL